MKLCQMKSFAIIVMLLTLPSYTPVILTMILSSLLHCKGCLKPKSLGLISKYQNLPAVSLPNVLRMTMSRTNI